MKKDSFVFILIIICTLFALLPLFREGFFVTDDGEWMIIRFSAFHQALRDGELPVRFLGRLNQEYGYPVTTFLYPGFLYIAEPLRLIGFGFVTSIKLVLGFSFLFSGIFTYFWLRKFFDTFSSFIGAVCYLFLPYHLYNLYTRGSVGEMLALAVLPFIFWQIERKSIFWSSLGIGVLILSHNTLAALFLPLLVLYLLQKLLFAASGRKHGFAPTEMYRYLGIVILGLGLSAFFWIPALYELRYTVFSETTVADWREYFALLSLLGYPTLFIVMITVLHAVYFFFTRRGRAITWNRPYMFFIAGSLSLFLASSLSTPVWHVLPVDFVQFPFRFLAVTLLCSAFLIAWNLSLLQGGRKIVLGVTFFGIIIFSAIPFAHPTDFFDKGEGYYATNMATTTVHDEYMPLWVKEKPTSRAEQKVILTEGEGSVRDISFTNNRITFIAEVAKDATLQIQTIYWPGWEASIDRKPVPILYTNTKGLMELSMPEGEHRVKVEFKETPVRLVSDVISVVNLLILIGISIRVRGAIKKR